MRCHLLVLLFFTGCTSLVPSTLRELSALSPLTADPSGFEVALDLPLGLDFQPGSARLRMEVRRDDTGAKEVGTYILERLDHAQTVLRIDRGDLAHLRDLQEKALAWEDENSRATQGSLSIGLAPCKRGAGPAENAKVSVWIRLEDGGALMPLLRDAPISRLRKGVEIATLPDCATGPF